VKKRKLIGLKTKGNPGLGVFLKINFLYYGFFEKIGFSGGI
jgi:hypothetical protein